MELALVSLHCSRASRPFQSSHLLTALYITSSQYKALPRLIPWFVERAVII
jgi:hypothetical protein